MTATKEWKLTLILLIIFSLAFAGLARIGSAAEGTRFLASYGGTAGYQLPLWVNKEFGFGSDRGGARRASRDRRYFGK